MEPLLQALLHRHSAAKSVIGEETIKNLHQELDSCAKQLKSAIHASNDVQIAASWNRIKKSKKLAQLACLANLKTKEWPKSLPELEALSKDIVLGKSSGETVLVYAVAKFGFFDSTPNPIVGQKPKKKEFRSIMSFGRKKRAKNWLIYTLLDMVQSNPTGNFLYKRLGTGRLSDAIKAEFESGKSWVVLFDASNFYSSVQGTKWVSEKLKMPVNVALEELFTSPETHLMLGECLTMHSQAQFLEAARLGLPQGLATSLIVGRIVYEDVLTTLFPMKRYFFYGDDGIIFASCKSDAVAIANTLRGAFESHPAGPFALKRCKVCHVADGFDFVMYRYRRKIEGMIHRTPSLSSFKRYEEKIASIVCGISDPDELFERMDSYTKAWLKSFVHWHPNAVAMDIFWQNQIAGIELGEMLLAKKNKQLLTT